MPRGFNLFRYRKPSLGEIIGTTAAERRISRELGLANLRDPLNPIKNMERRAKSRVGYYSEPIKLARKAGCSGILFLVGLAVTCIAARIMVATIKG